MATGWFRVPEVGSSHMGPDVYRPAHMDIDGIDEYSGSKEHPDGAPVWVVHVSGTQEALNELSSKSGVQEMGDNQVENVLNALNDGPDRTLEEWEDFKT